MYKLWIIDNKQCFYCTAGEILHFSYFPGRTPSEPELMVAWGRLNFDENSLQGSGS
jgi:hypothetical protein